MPTASSPATTCIKNTHFSNMSNYARVNVQYADARPYQEGKYICALPLTSLIDIPVVKWNHNSKVYQRWTNNRCEPFPVSGAFAGVPGRKGDLYAYHDTSGDRHVFYHDGWSWRAAIRGFEPNGLPIQMYPTTPGTVEDKSSFSAHVYLDWDKLKWSTRSKWTPSSKRAS
jgi:hypothetical protein